MRRLLTAALLVLTVAQVAEARCRLFGSRARPPELMGSRMCVPQVATPAAARGPIAKPVLVSPAANLQNCPGGVCPAPTVARWGR